VNYSSQLSSRYVFENYPELAADTVSNTRVPPGWNVDEALSRFLGGRQSPFNQRMMPSWLNQWLGPQEFNAVSLQGLAPGTRIVGIDVIWAP
jgi:hypothetical protein